MNTKAAARKAAGVVAVGAVLVLAGGAGGAGDAASAASGPSLVRIASASEGASQLKLSPDGRYAVFVSAQRLTPADTTNNQQVWLRNLQTGATTLVSVGLDGQAGNADSSGGWISPGAGAAISADDRYVAFTSAASNLVPGGTSGLGDVFVRDLAAGTTSLVSVHLAGVTGNNGGHGSGGPVISADGRYVAFSSDASDLVPNDPHQPYMDVFLRDMSTGTTTQVTTTGTYGALMYGYTGSIADAITPDGQYVLFTSTAYGVVPGYGGAVHDVYRWQQGTTTPTLVSLGIDGRSSRTGRSDANGSLGTAISADGRYAAFDSDAVNMVAGNTYNNSNVYVRDLLTGTTTLVSAEPGGSPPPDAPSNQSSMSADGRYVAFESSSQLLGPTVPPTAADHVYLRDLQSGTISLADVSATGQVGNGSSSLPAYPSLSADGHSVAFTSNATNLLPGSAVGDWLLSTFAATAPPPAPAVTGIGPASGPAAGGTAVTVTGSNLTGGTVAFGGTAATGVSCSASSCTAASPAGTGTVDVTVTTAGGTSATGSADRFTYTAAPPPAPAVTGVSPASGPAAGGTAVTVTGSNLAGGTVAFGSAAATGVSCSASSCTAASPAGTGTVDVTVTTAGGTSAASSADRFTYTAAPPPAPAVTGVSPASGPAAGGTAVTVTGSNLAGGTVAFGSAAATGVSCSASSCTAASPAGTGTVDVTVTTAGGTSAASSADRFTYTATPPPNLIPNPGFEAPGVPSDHAGSTLARSQTVVHSGSWALAQTTRSSSGGWDLDSNPSWYVPVSPAHSYTAGIWVRSTATVRVDLGLDLLDSSGNYIDTASGPTVTLAAGTWTHLTITGIQPAAGEVYAGMGPNFSRAASGTVIYWDDMSLTSP